MTFGKIFTGETALTRALAAEIRFNDSAIRQYLPTEHQGDTLVNVQCEEKQRIDILATYQTPKGDEYRVGLEAKLQHSLGEDQLEREKSICDFLFLLVLEQEDVNDEMRSMVDHVFTWKELLPQIKDCRIIDAEIVEDPFSKRNTERMMSRIHAEAVDKFGEGWDLKVTRNGTGAPSIEIHGPDLPEEYNYPGGAPRHLRGQIQPIGRGSKFNPETSMFQLHVGFSVDEDIDFLEDLSIKPDWVDPLLELAWLLETPDFDSNKLNLNANVLTRPPSRGRRESGKRKMLLAEKWLGNYKYMAKGTVDWSIGPRFAPTPFSDLDKSISDAAILFRTWDKVLRG